MPTPIPDQWRRTPPETLVIGSGPFSTTLAMILGSASLTETQLSDGPKPKETGGFDRVLDDLKCVFLVVSESASAVEALHFHDAVWNWIGKLTSAGDQHDLAFIFVLPPDTSPSYDAALAVGLAVSKVDPASSGHAVWRQSGSLEELLDLIAQTHPMDLVLLRSRRAADCRHRVLAELRAAAAQDDSSAIAVVAQSVRAAFAGHEYDLDLFCRPPSHRHGNLLREWLAATVTPPVTPDRWTVARQQLAAWLAEE